MLLAGQVGRPHGLGGEVYVMPISDDPRRFEAGAVLVHEVAGELVVEAARRHHDRLLVRFAGIGDRAAAERLRGALYVASDDLRPLGPDEYWEHEIVGCRVHDASGGEVGEVVDVIGGRAQGLLRVRTAGGERLVPMVADIVVSVDIPARRVVLDPPAGLMD
jgi:16S rRNA processing protein RimM